MWEESQPRTHNCLICGKEYPICLNCVKIFSGEEYHNFSMADYVKKHGISEEDSQSMFLGYKSTSCCMNHYFVFGYINMLQNGEKTALEIKNELQRLGYDSTDVENFLPEVRDYLLANVYGIKPIIDNNSKVIQTTPTRVTSRKRRDI